MGNAAVHFEIIGQNPELLRDYYNELFDWTYDTSGPVPPEVSDAGDYGFTEGNTTISGAGIPGGIGGGPKHVPHTVVYIEVPDVEQALARAVSLGGTRTLGPSHAAGSPVTVAQFTDPEGNLVGLAQIG